MTFHPILSALLRSKTGPILVALQVGLSLAILANALHIVDERRAMAARPSGLADEHAIFSISVRDVADMTPELELSAMKRQIDVLRAIPGVVAVANVSQMPLSRSGSTASLALDRRQTRESAQASMYIAGDSLVKGFGLRLIEGRDFLPHEVIEVNLSASMKIPAQGMMTKPLADKLWPQASAVGRTIYFGSGENAQAVQIVGVVERLQSPHAQAGPEAEQSIVIPARLYGAGQGSLLSVRTEAGQRDRVMREAETALVRASPMPQLIRMVTVDDDRNARYRADLALQWALIIVSVLLLLVTCSGIVGMASLWVAQRRKQIGVRRALGARRIDILRYFIAENLIITSCGVVTGLLLGVQLNQLLVSQLEVAHLPFVYLAGGAIMLWILGVAAAWGPAWRAARISPATATRGVTQ